MSQARSDGKDLAMNHDSRAQPNGSIPTPSHGSSVAVAESCTGGHVMAQIVATPGSGDWFRGGVVAYDRQVKFDLLDVIPGPVVTSEAAAQMATGVRRLMGADIGIATTGEAGPDPEEDVPVGTVYVAVADANSVEIHHVVLSGKPEEIRSGASDLALSHLRRRTGLDVHRVASE
jgi:PncC family amidohydrolase